MNLDAACAGSCMERPYNEIQILLNNFTANDNNWHGDGEPRRELKQKAAGSSQCGYLEKWKSIKRISREKKYTASPEGELVPKPVEENKNENKGSEPVIVARPPPPFPQRLQKQKDDTKYKKFLDILSQVRVNLPLVEILQEVPLYARYLRDILANKRIHTEFETVALTEKCSVRVQSKLPPKLKDPGCFAISLSLGKQEVGRALCDLGANRSLVMLEGIIEDVLVQVGKFILPVDFIILDYEADEEVPIILGRPFLATGGAIIDVREGKLKMRVDDEEITFNVYKLLKLPKHYKELCMITVVELKGIE
ncbi:uncharacterized protein [Nicotiana sylvestris]|uniref:uncharacterized protein n=1 Tax=Nicotiana sylvestris TaxID=4096 RepID=UPI00388C5ADE